MYLPESEPSEVTAEALQPQAVSTYPPVENPTTAKPETGGLTCFVVMPFGSGSEYARGNKESNYVFHNVIQPSLALVSSRLSRRIDTLREVDSGNPGSITRAILHHIAEADICIVDITGRNANVFFELGIRYGLRPRITLLLRQESTPIPFDISGYRCLTYDCLEPDIAIAAISDALYTALKNASSVDSLIFETFPDMRINIPGIIDTSSSSNIQSWDEWWEGVRRVIKLLAPAAHNGRLVPKAVLGISNGGLVAADIITRELYRGTPLLALWQDRWRKDKDIGDQACFYFDHPTNIAVLHALRGLHPSDAPILLIDDVIYRGTTTLQAIHFLEKHLGQHDLLLMPIFCRDTAYLGPFLSYLPPGYKGGSIFGMTEHDYYSMICTPKSFPYKVF
jgi:hypothetical protein